MGSSEDLRSWLQTISCEAAFDVLVAAGFDSLAMLTNMDDYERQVLKDTIEDLPPVKQARLLKRVHEITREIKGVETELKDEPLTSDLDEPRMRMTEILTGYSSDDGIGSPGQAVLSEPLDEPESPASHGSRSRSRTPRMREPPIPTVDNLPPLPPKPNRKPGRSRVPRDTPPRKNLGWDITRTAKGIHRCQLPGDWYQGGQNDRFVYTNDDQTYYINQQSQSMWVQGQEDHIINARMLASFNQARRPEVAGRAQ